MAFPLSQSQLGIFYACQGQDGKKCNYQVPVLYSLPEDIDLEKLRTALDSVIQAHPYMLSRIVLKDGEPCTEDGDFEGVSIIQLHNIEEVSETFGMPFDLLGNKLFRLELYATDTGNYLFLDLHHIINDGTAFNCFLDHIGRAYSGEKLQAEETGGNEIALNELEFRRSPLMYEERDWYIKTFSPAAELDSSPIAESLIPENAGKKIVETDLHLSLSDDTVRKIKDKYGVRESVIFTAAWAKLLSDFSADDKAAFSTIFHGRTDKRTLGSVTMMVRTLPVYSEMPASKSISEWLEELSDQQSRARQCKAYSFKDLYEDTSFSSKLKFAYQGRLVPDSKFPIELNGRPVNGKDLRAPLPGTILDAQLFARPEGYILRISYETSLYTPGLVRNMADSFCSIVKSMETAVTIAELETCSPEQTAWLDSLNPDNPIPITEGLAAAFRKNAAEHPDRECCVFEEVRLSYRQVDELTDSLAARISQTAGKGETVSFICLRNEMMVLIPLAAVKAGCIYQPLDYSYPPERLEYMIKDAGAKLLICPPDKRELVKEYTGECLFLTTHSDIEPCQAHLPDDAKLDEPLCLLYTSGTTGTPKGVIITHRNIISIVRYSQERTGLDGSCRYASYASYGFDAFLLDIWSSMYSGCPIHIISEAIRYDLVSIKEMFEKEGITHSVMTTQVATQLAVNYPDIKGFRSIIAGGEKLASINAPSYMLVNGYGPTEATAYTSSYILMGGERNVPIGVPTANARLYVVNRSGKRVPAGAAGELWTSGPQTAAGYLNLPEKTAEAFIANPFVEKDSPFARIYRTGDIVRYREDGLLEFVGRRDGQVKIRGFRVELKEIESVIREYDGIREVTVQAFDLESGGKALAAYIVSESKIDVNALNSFIADRKPPYMVPAVTMQLDSIPLNVNGKVDRKRLPVPQVASDEKTSAESPAAPLNTLEKELSGMVSSLTNCGDFPITLPLTSLGLTSISSLKLAIEVHKRYGVKLNNSELTHGATLQDIENTILDTLLRKGPQEDPKPQEREEKLSAPLTGAQTGVYFDCRKNPDSTIYNIPFVATFPEGTDPVKLKEAVEKVISMHPLLSAVIDSGSDPIMQRSVRTVKPHVSNSDKTAEELRRSFVRPFDLEHGPLYRIEMCGNKLFMDFHHLVMDGASVSLLLQQICDCLEGKPLRSEEISYFRHAREEAAADNSAAEAFFKEALSGTDGGSAVPPDLHGKEEDGRIAEAVRYVDHAAIVKCAGSNGVTPASVYLAATDYLTARYCNSKEVCICTVSSGRSDLRCSGTTGMFVNTLALAAKIGEGSVGSFIKDVANNFGSTIAHENYPFAKISAAYGIEPGLMFVYQMGLMDKPHVGGVEVGMESLELSVPKAKICIQVEERDGKACLVTQYNDALYSDDMMQRFTDSLSTVLENMAAFPDSPVRNVSIVSASQRAELAGMHNVCVHPITENILHESIEKWSRTCPERTAVIAADRSLSYAEFSAESNRIANALLACGLKKGDAVVVLLPRRCSTLSCVLGILKAGGAFIPCDPEYPTERIRLIADDSGAPFVVTTAELAPNYGSRGLVIDRLLERGGAEDPWVKVCPTDLAYMIYTSGSTGKPKGVLVSHENITTLLAVSKENPQYPLTQCKRMCTVATISFDAFVFGYTMCLTHGNTLVFTSENQSKDPIALTALLKNTGADYMDGTCSRMLQYLELPEFAECLKSFKVIVQGGEKFSELLLSKLKALNSGITILNGYGPTEISISCNVKDLSDGGRITVGKPLPNYYEWILDKDCNELPVGVTGELCVGGRGVTGGYRNLPDKTAEKYIRYSGMRAFRTGDYARWTPEGEVEILGRTDNQVKLRGLRIELGEVENAISSVAGVKNVLVKICKIQDRDHLSAYYVADRRIEAAELKEHISRTLTAYMVPTAYLQLDAFPVTPNGKVDFRHLPEPSIARDGDVYVEPSGAAEKFFAACFAHILGSERVGASDSFFDLGGTSLVVMKVVIEAQKAGYPVSYSDVFSNPTPRALAALVAGDGSEPEEKDPDADVKDFDYSGIERVLALNTAVRYAHCSEQRPLGTVLLTGSTGFLGIHILRRLLEDYPDTSVHCLLRSRKNVSAEERLRNLMFYYFEKDFSEYMGKRVFVHEGDVTAPLDIDAGIDTVINCAALVKHFAKGSEIEDVNVGGVRNCIEFSLKKNARLIQISTYSIAGTSVNGEPAVSSLTESMLYFGQRLHNQYIHSKIMGERLILDAVAGRGLDAKIMRVGNLSARSEDGEFQINVKANSFMGRLRIFQMLGVLPYSAYQSHVEFSPIDETAQAICLLSGTPRECTVFHPYNSHAQMLGDVLVRMKTIGKDVRLVEDSEFMSLLNEAKADPARQEQLSAMLAYETKPVKDVMRVIPADNAYTVQMLLRLGFRWDTTSWDYVDRFLEQIDTLDFFDQ